MRLFVVIVANKDGGYGVQLRSRLAATIPDMQGRRERRLLDAKRYAERLFGPLHWFTRDEVGLQGQPYVEAVADIEVKGVE